MTIENKTLMETLIDAGYPREEMYHHCSDLYIFWTPTTVQIVVRFALDVTVRAAEGGTQMIEHIRDIIAWGLNEDFWGEDSLLVDGFHECYGEQLTCEGFCAYPSSTDDNVVYVDIGEDSVHRFKITIEEV